MYLKASAKCFFTFTLFGKMTFRTKKIVSSLVFHFPRSLASYILFNMQRNKEKILYILHLFFDQGEIQARQLKL